jgi:hypothetical protein
MNTNGEQETEQKSKTLNKISRFKGSQREIKKDNVLNFYYYCLDSK